MNNQIFYFFYNFANRSTDIDKLVVFFAKTFPYIVALLALIFLFKRRARLKVFVQVILSSGLAWLVAKALKTLIHADRPFLRLPDIHSLFSETGFAFPSGHATFFAALGASLFFYRKKAGVVFLFFALLIGVARIVAGVHFPIDILGGFALGVLIAYLLRSL